MSWAEASAAPLHRGKSAQQLLFDQAVAVERVAEPRAKRQTERDDMLSYPASRDGNGAVRAFGVRERVEALCDFVKCKQGKVRHEGDSAVR